MLTLDLDYLPLRRGDRVLDLGCGLGRHAIALAIEKPIKVVAVDLSHQDICVARRRWQEACAVDSVVSMGDVTFCCAHAHRLPFADDSFDVVVFSEVLEHLPDYGHALAEVRRVLRPAGLLGLSVPCEWPEKLCWALSFEYTAEPGGHVRVFKRKLLLREMHALGFAHYRSHRAHALHSVLWWLKCLFWRRRESAWSVRIMHRLLVWQIMRKPRVLNTLERVLNPLCGKSEVMYFYQMRGVV